MITTFPEYISLACIPFLRLYFSCVPAFPFDSSMQSDTYNLDSIWLVSYLAMNILINK